MNRQTLLWIGLVWLVAVSVGAQEHELDEHAHEEDLIRLASAQMVELDLETIPIRRGELTQALGFPAELQFDPMRVAHLTPRVEGMVKEVRFRLGDAVKKGEVLAVLESRELGTAKSNYLAALARESLRQKTFAREKRLWEKRISAEQDFLLAEQALAESRIEVRQAREALFALGLDREDLVALPTGSAMYLNRYEMTAPFDGRVVEQHVTLGEVIKEERAAFVVVDLREMWVIARVAERDLTSLRTGLEGIVTLNGMPGRVFSGTLDFIGHQLDPDTRTAPARLVLDNPDATLRAGMFGNLTVMAPSPRKADAFMIPRAALQRGENGAVVFLQVEPGVYRMVPVIVTAQSGDFAQVNGELKEGDQLVTGDTFILKSQAGKETLGEGHAH